MDNNQDDGGTYEKGSSGSPLFDQNGRVIGQLRGGLKGCNYPREFWHGCFHRSWTGGGDSTNQLSHWLDPCDTERQTLNTIRSAYISGPSPLCSSSKNYTLHNEPPNTTEIDWTASPSGLFTYTSGSGTTFNTAWDGSGSGTGT